MCQRKAVFLSNEISNSSMSPSHRNQTGSIRATEPANPASEMLQRLLKEKEYEYLRDVVERYHKHSVSDGQFSSVVVRWIRAMAEDVWSVVRRFDKPQTYKHFIRSCSMQGDGTAGSTRELRVVSGLPAKSSTERLEILDDDHRVLSFRVVGGEHRLKNYQSFRTVHEVRNVDKKDETLVIESYVVDVPEGNSPSDTCFFVDTIITCNLQSLARICERLPTRREAKSKVSMEGQKCGPPCCSALEIGWGF